ncbi:heavy metal-binding domain-containing protein [Corallococcus coralloides]|uniref:heavy metal-binding domain-containing protein n=2 Tax=Cystobacterineae TaxID=80811 RepID=UPI00384F5FED
MNHWAIDIGPLPRCHGCMSPRSPMRRTLVVLASILSFAACVSEQKRPPAAMDPSNPDAPEAPPAAQPTAFAAPTPEVPAPAKAPEGAGHAGHGAVSPASASDAGTTVYTCPMHPEVRSSKPGTCPKCGMKLVPEKPSGAEATDAGQPGSAPAGHEHGHGGHP